MSKLIKTCLVIMLLMLCAGVTYATPSDIPFLPLDAYAASVEVTGDGPWYGDQYVTLIDGAQSLGAEDNVNATVSINASELGHDEVAFIVWRLEDPIVLNTESEYTIDYAGRCGGRGPGYCLSGLITDSVAFDGPAIAYGGGDPYHQNLDDAYAGTVVYGVYLGFSVYASEVSTFTVDYIYISGDAYVYPTATPAPTGTPAAEATAAIYLNTQACAIGATSTPIRTPTRFYTQTVTTTPTRTGTPATPTPTGTPTAASYDSGEDDFASGLGQWTTGGDPVVFATPADGSPVGALPPTVITSTGWSSETGMDGISGVAMIGNSYAFNDSYNGDTPGFADMETLLTDGRDMLVYSVPEGITMPVHIRGAARYTGRILAGNAVYARVVLYSPNYIDDQGRTVQVWFSPTDTQDHQKYIALSRAWNYFDWEYTAPVSQTITAVGILWVEKTGDSWPYHATWPWQYVNTYGGALGAIDLPPQGVMLFDDLRTTSGGDLQLPICPVTGGGGYGIPTPVPLRQCTITYNDIDVYAACVTPASWTDIGGWLSWVWCRISKFFEFNVYNRNQLSAMQSRQNVNEPIGTLNEVGAISTDLMVTLAQVQGINRPAPSSPLNFINLFDLSVLDHPETLFNFSTAAEVPMAILECPAALANKGESFAYGACMSIVQLKDTIIVALVQWMLNAALLWSLIRYVYKTIKTLGE